jgi:hypothetical protein
VRTIVPVRRWPLGILEQVRDRDDGPHDSKRADAARGEQLRADRDVTTAAHISRPSTTAAKFYRLDVEGRAVSSRGGMIRQGESI